MNRIAVINPDTPEDIKKGLISHDFEILSIPRCRNLAVPIQGHPDLQVFIHANKLFCQPDISRDFLDKAENHVEVIKCTERLSHIYPGDVYYNIAIAGNSAFHREDLTSGLIADYLRQNGISILNVRQGYSRCSVVPLNSNHIITADRGIHNSAISNNVDSLLITQGYVDLPGYRYGFLGGAAGIFENTLYFTGRLDHHPDYEKIMEFIASCRIDVCFLSENRVIDLGSILFI